jgi:hypothetical protein
MKKRSIYIGFDTRQADAFAVAMHSCKCSSGLHRPSVIRGLVRDRLRSEGFYTRPDTLRDGRMWCPISEAPLSTEFANSRFLVPFLARDGYALFTDSDMLFRSDVNELFDICEADPSKAVWCVKHEHQPVNETKMDGQIQTKYARKNWSSVMVFNCDHPANRALTIDDVNSRPGRDLHRFYWLDDKAIGSLGVEWNWLAGHSPEAVVPKIVHFTDGVPSMPGYEDSPFAEEWFYELHDWAGTGVG